MRTTACYFLVVPVPKTPTACSQAGAPVEIGESLGGLHYREGRVQVLKAVSLNLSDIDALRKLDAGGVVTRRRGRCRWMNRLQLN